jgi:DNA polymerase-1
MAHSTETKQIYRGERAPKLLLIDGHALVHRAYHALPELTTSSGELVNAVFGWSSMVLKAFETIKPTHAIVAFDLGRTFRHEQYEAYKATRPRTPPPLVMQFNRVRQVAQAFHMCIAEVPGFEADDVLGTLARQAEEVGIPSVIVTGDLDTLQLVDDSVSVLTSNRQFGETKLYTPVAIRERYGLSPKQIPDLKGLIGDTTDNIPGIKGIGEKTAAKLLTQYGSLEGIYEHIDEIKGNVGRLLRENREQAFESRRLATIVTNVPVTLDLDRCAVEDFDRTQLLNLFRELEFRSLIPRVQQLYPHFTEHGQGVGTVQQEQLSLFTPPSVPQPAPKAASTATAIHDDIVTGSAVLLEGERGGTVQTQTKIITTKEALTALVAQLTATDRWAFDTETTSTQALEAELVGLSFALMPGCTFYVPVRHEGAEQLPLEYVLETLRPALENPKLRKIGHNLKYDIVVLGNYGIRVEGVYFDTMVAAYLENPTGRSLSLSSLALARLGLEMTPITSLIGRGKQQISMAQVNVRAVAAYAGMDAETALRLADDLEERLSASGLSDLFYTVEMPLVSVLADMERAGVALDIEVLAEMSKELTELLGAIEGRIYERVGHRFNINSTQQLGSVLFNELKLPKRKRTKTGYSTDNEVLEHLRGQHPIIDDILEYRQLIKLKNTYIDALPQLISPRDGRVHTDFNQTGTATGRLSSSNPNLQNIPIRSELGRKIRRAFIPGLPGAVLMTADYSQIELRILAHMSGDPRLIEAFTTGQDIHTATAAAVWNIDPAMVTPEQRRIAKIVNFGIIYGIGDQRLAYETGLSREEAARFIASYNRTYAKVKEFMDAMRRQAMLYGQVSTLLGRIRSVPEIHSDHPGVRQAAERAAINMPVQGTAADIIKIAMVRIAQRLRYQGLRSQMILQVHDELVFEVPRCELPEVAALVRECMEKALELAVPLEVELKIGENWGEMQPYIER